jgi:chemotaxis methyl-accepting protein methylase
VVDDDERRRGTADRSVALGARPEAERESGSDELDAELAALSEHVAKVAGLRLGDRQRWLFAARVDARRARTAESRARYAARVLAGDTEELAALVEALRVGETRFYRHPRQLRALRRVALPELVARCEAEGRPLRVWSAGCASGEEAYTLTLMLRDAFPELAFDVWATDLSADAIAHARAGRYDAERARDVPETIAARDLARDGAHVRVRERARENVRFEVHNLLLDPYPRGLDLVLCRNVLIYFDAATRTRVIAQLFGAVREGGYVALGYADHAGDVGGAEALRTDDGVLYRRGSGPVRVVLSDVAQEPRTSGPFVSTPRPASPPTKARRDVTKVTRSDTARSDTARSDTARSDTARSDTARSDTARSDTARSDTARSDTARSERSESILTTRFSGELAGAEGLVAARRTLAPLLHARGGVLDLAELRFADDDVGRELARAAEALGEALVIVAPAGGIERFLRRHGVVPPATLRRSA